MSGVTYEATKYRNAPFKVTATLTRPANTTAYSSLDAITDSTSSPSPLEFDVEGAPDGAILTIQQAELMRSGTSTDYFELWLFHTEPTANNDNDAFSLSDSDNDKGDGGIIDFEDARSAVNALRYVTTLEPGNKIKLPYDGKKFYGLLKSKSGHTPESAETYKIELKGIVG